VYSVFGEKPRQRDPDVLYVQFSGESFSHDPNCFDVNLIPALESPVTVPHTLGGLHIYTSNLTARINQPRIYENKTHFCSFVVSNPGPQERIQFYKLLNSYKKVDSCGRWNNTGVRIPESDTPEYYEFMSRYKFTICFENSQKDYYFTEKLINAYVSNTVPIYWGCPHVPSYLNTDAMVYIPDATPDGFKKALDRVIELETNSEAYKRVYEQPLFVDGKIPDVLNMDVIRKRIASLLKR
jgi:hypothetical protein